MKKRRVVGLVWGVQVIMAVIRVSLAVVERFETLPVNLEFGNEH